MQESSNEGRAFTWCAALLAGLACLANEWVLRLASPDGTLADSTRVLVRCAQAGLLAVAALVFLLRVRLPHLFQNEGRAMAVLLVLGIVIRVAVFPTLGPDNNDPHREVVEYVVEHGWTPTADEATLGFQPPLYYLLAAPWALAGSAKLTQFFSLLLSLANLLLLYRLLRTTKLLRDPRARCHAFALVALLPQFILFGLFVSNDALGFLLGSVIFSQTLLYVDRPTGGRLFGLGVALGLGLLTKGTFTAFVPVLLTLVVVLGLRRRLSLAAHARALALLAVPALGLGCYKFVKNYVQFGTQIGRAHV